MVYYTYARGPEHTDADVATGEPATGTQLQVWTSDSGGTQITALKTVAGSALPGYVTVDAFGRYEFRIDSLANPIVWMKDPSAKFWQILASEVIGQIPDAVAVGSTKVDKGSLAFDVKDYGAVGNGIADDTTAIQAAITAAAAAIASIAGDVRVWVLIPPGHYKITSITLPGRVGLVGNGARLSALSAAAMITASGEYNAIVGLLLLGSGASVDASGVTLASGSRWTLVENCRFDQMAGRAIYDQGVANWITRVHAQNCLLDADTLGVFTGVIETVGTDMWLTDSELTASRYSVAGASASMKACALLINGANVMISNVVAETSDHGVYLDSGATQVNMVGVRAELNYGHGWYINGGNGRIANPMALRNSKAGDNLYNGFHVSGVNSTRYLIVNAWSDSTSSTLQNYGMFDNNISMSVFNRWINPFDVGSSNSFFATNTTGTSWSFPDNPPFNLPSGATPVVSGARNWIAVAGSPQTVTNFTKGVNGQRLTIKGDGNTTLAQGATIVNTSGANLLLATGVWYNYLRVNGVWTQT